MLKKLFRQEWKSFSFAPMITMIVLAVVTLILMSSFMTSFWEQDNIFVNLFASLTFLAYAFALAALSFCVTLCTAIRFYKNFFTDEGYLMFTLPVKTSDLLLSKIFVAALWKLVSVAAITISVLVIATVGFSYLSDTSVIRFFEEFFDLFPRAIEEMRDVLAIPVSVFFLWLILLGICSLFYNILFIYACICLGQLWNKHKIGGAIVAYFGLRFVLRLFRQILSIPLSNFYSYYYDFDSISTGTWLFGMFISLLIMGGLCVGLYWICSYVMSRKLNLD